MKKKPAQRMTAEIVEQASQDAAETAIVDLVRKLVEAAKDGRAHMSHEDGATCMGCIAVRDGLNFVYLMTRDKDAEQAVAPPIEPKAPDPNGSDRIDERKPTGCMVHPWRRHKYCTRCDVIARAEAAEQIVEYESTPKESA